MNLTQTEILDELEDIAIKAFLPTVKEIKKAVNFGELSDEEVARNLLSRIGTGLAFGKKLYDTSIKL